MGVAQAADGLPQVLEAGLQQRHRPHQLRETTSGNVEARSSATHRFHPRRHLLLLRVCHHPCLLAIVNCQLSILPLTPLLIYALLICIDSTIQNKNLKVGLLSIPAAFVQLMGYGCGFIESWWKRCVLKKDEFQAFEKNFYK